VKCPCWAIRNPIAPSRHDGSGSPSKLLPRSRSINSRPPRRSGAGTIGDARDKEAYEALLGDELADLIFYRPSYNVPIDGHVCGSGRIRHREFAMGVGEMSSAEFTAFLEQTLACARAMPRWTNRLLSAWTGGTRVRLLQPARSYLLN
jgi:hypothetical protein